MQSADTSDEAREAQIRFYRRLTPEQRLELALEMCDAAREVSSAGIRARHPGWTEEQVRRELARIAFAAAERSGG